MHVLRLPSELLVGSYIYLSSIFDIQNHVIEAKPILCFTLILLV
jgi:hypothetical protein